MKNKVKIIILLFIGVFTLVGCTPNVYVNDAEKQRIELIEKLEKTTVALAIEKMNGSSLGSGTIFKKETIDSQNRYYVLTNKHVVEGGITAKVQIGNSIEEGKIFHKFQTSHSYDDIAIVTFDSKKIYQIQELIPYERNTQVVLKKGQDVLAIGTPLKITNYNMTTNGIISLVSEKWIVHTASIFPGNSGGPLFDSKGTYIGMNTSRDTNESDISHAIHVNYIAEKLVELFSSQAN
ncbi:hypothetical protein BN85412590 [Alteracholeplasma palmae J233]|uniref:Serine protease n=1 Tax=Alteracholeplasma palmae (strain ATCC 49389 / J233) TaxID=1318466 RepID=U4KS91_ALTPJ|nr:S1C family serine protease [Alteracholeplasma palmae]CCV64836.1 hypothetical protein BN85412590 [Alteracholeplasma palmae J233]